jgi:hypothetical protein
MNTYRQRPKGSFTEEASWEELYRLAKIWQTDIEFYQDDSRFLQHLLDKYFIWIIEKDSYQMVSNLQNNLLKITAKGEDLLKKIEIHLEKLAGMVEHPSSMESRVLRLEHAHMEDEIHDFTALFRGNRKSIFMMVENVVMNEKVKHLLSNFSEDKIQLS